MASDLPEDRNGMLDFDLEDSLDTLNGLLAEHNITIDDMEERSQLGRTLNLRKDLDDTNVHELDRIISDTMKDPDMNNVDQSRSDEVDEFNKKFEVDLENDNPTFIFPDDRKTHNFVGMIQQANQSFIKERDMFNIPPQEEQQP